MVGREIVPSIQTIFHLSEILFSSLISRLLEIFFSHKHSIKGEKAVFEVEASLSLESPMGLDSCLFGPECSSAEHKPGAPQQLFQKSHYLSAVASSF